MNAGVCTSTKARTERDGERDIQQNLLQREAYGHVLDTQWVRSPDQPHTGYLDIVANRIGEEIDRVSELAQTLNHLTNRYRSAPILIEWLGCNEQHTAIGRS
jgi:hypothetical protein